jgi:glycosyltransferase involved in cell wall biosynthesis
MKLSIVTINYNNVEGLKRTLASVAEQSYRDIEHIIIDGGSIDGSVNVIKEYVATNPNKDPFFKHTIKWVSEKDNGIYNAMNKGIRKATGAYVQILNSGDILAAPNVVSRMVAEIEKVEYPELLYGNMIKKDFATGKVQGKSQEVEYSLRQYYASTMNHDCCYIRRDVYDKYGLYDENLKIVSDWKWFLQAIGLGNVKPMYIDIDVTIFDVSGISETNLELRHKERRQVLEEVLPSALLADYDAYSFQISQYQRLKKYHLWPIVYFMERVLFKLNKWKILKRCLVFLS